MLAASILKIFYWPGARYDTALLVQAGVMVVVQAVLLKVALDNRPRGGRDGGVPFKDLDSGKRPGKFWRWRDQRPYWECVGGLVLVLMVLQTLLRPTPSTSSSSSSTSSLYTHILGYTGLAIEATLPIPQMLANQHARSCKGFRVSVLANWLVGDAMKMAWFFMAGDGKVPVAFKMCGVFQAGCDLALGCQWWVFGDGEGANGREREKGGLGSGRPV